MTSDSKVTLSLRVRPDSEVSRWVYDEIVRLERERDDLRLRLDDAHDCETHLREALRMANEYAEKLETAMSCPWHPDGKHYCEPCGMSVGEAP